jgi:hypothetical protein
MTEKQENYKKRIVKDIEKSISFKKDQIEMYSDPINPDDQNEIVENTKQIEKLEKEITEMEKVKKSSFDEMITYHKKHFRNAFYG